MPNANNKEQDTKRDTNSKLFNIATYVWEPFERIVKVPTGDIRNYCA